MYIIKKNARFEHSGSYEKTGLSSRLIINQCFDKDSFQILLVWTRNGISMIDMPF